MKMKTEAPLKLDLHGRLDDNSIKKLNKHCKGKGLFFASGFSCKKEHSDKDYSIVLEMVAAETVAMGNISEPKPPSTKVEYVRVEDSIFHPKLQSDFESELLFYSNDDESFVAFTGDERTLMRCLLECSLYRRIETPITEREEFEIKFNNLRDEWDSSCDDFITLADFLYSNDCRFVGK